MDKNANGLEVICGSSALLQRVCLRAGVPSTPKKHQWLWLFLLLLACWMPLLLAYGPVRMSADSVVVIGQAVGGNPLSDAHPILYTFLVGACLRLGQMLGSILAGAYLFSLLQMAFLAAVLSYSVHWMHKNGCPALLCLPALACFALSPVFALNGLTMWKDVPFNACLLLLVMLLYPICQSRGAWLIENRHMAVFLGLCAAVCFLRGNGFVLVLATCAGLVLAFRTRAKRLLLFFAGLLAVIALIQGPLYAAFGIGRLGTVESAAIPLQQVGRAIATGAELNDEQREIIERFMPVESIRENYRPPSPDYIKKHPDFNTPAFNQNFGDFMRVWLELAPQNAAEYANAWLLETLGYWKFDFAGRTVYTEDENNGVYGIEYKDLVHRFTGFNLRQFALDRSAFLTMGVMALAVLFACAQLIAGRQSRMALCFLPLVLLWLGLMLGAPTYSDFRYMLVFAFAMPVVVFITLSGAGRAEAGFGDVDACGPAHGASGFDDAHQNKTALTKARRAETSTEVAAKPTPEAEAAP